MPLRTYKGFILSPVLKEEAYLSKGRMPTLNKEMSLQDVHMLLSINDKQSLQKKQYTSPALAGVIFLWITCKELLNKQTANKCPQPLF